METGMQKKQEIGMPERGKWTSKLENRDPEAIIR